MNAIKGILVHWCSEWNSDCKNFCCHDKVVTMATNKRLQNLPSCQAKHICWDPQSCFNFSSYCPLKLVFKPNLNKGHQKHMTKWTNLLKERPDAILETFYCDSLRAHRFQSTAALKLTTFRRYWVLTCECQLSTKRNNVRYRSELTTSHSWIVHWRGKVPSHPIELSATSSSNTGEKFGCIPKIALNAKSFRYKNFRQRISGQKISYLFPWNFGLSGPGGGVRRLDDQTHSCQSETSYSMMPKLCDS